MTLILRRACPVEALGRFMFLAFFPDEIAKPCKEQKGPGWRLEEVDSYSVSKVQAVGEARPSDNCHGYRTDGPAGDQPRAVKNPWLSFRFSGAFRRPHPGE